MLHQIFGGRCAVDSAEIAEMKIDPQVSDRFAIFAFLMLSAFSFRFLLLLLPSLSVICLFLFVNFLPSPLMSSYRFPSSCYCSSFALSSFCSHCLPCPVFRLALLSSVTILS